MRGLSAFIVLLLVIPAVLPGLSSCPGVVSAAATAPGAVADGLLLVEVCPGKPVEYVIIRNNGGEVDLNGTAISDGEGSLTFRATFNLAFSAEVAIAADASIFSKIYPDISCLEFTSPEIKKAGRFALADDGDDVRLLDSTGNLTDLLAYGKSTYSGIGWTGLPVAKGGSADALIRASSDTNTSSDWSPAPPGRTSAIPGEYLAVVEPFTVPENAAERLVRELEAAAWWVKAAVYELTDPAIVNAFADCARRGVNISVLIEGQPVGGLSEASRAAASALLNAGCEVKVLRSQDAYKRYDYLHCKYLVTDGFRSVIMSENWGTGLWCNRGWGVCADSTGLALYLEDIFDADFGGKLDVSERIDTATYSGQAAESPTVRSDLLRWKATVRPIISPDFSEKAMRDLIASAQEHILVEQMYCEEDWLDSPGLLQELFSAASRGVAVRILLDNTFSGKENGAVAKSINALAARESVDLQAKVISAYHGLSIMHNKGMIVDDQVLVSSINWGDSALRENREVGLLIRSPEIAGFFSGYFWQDWSDDPFPPTIRFSQESIVTYAGIPVLLDGSNITDRTGISLISWDLDGDGISDGTGTRIVATFGVGDHVVTVTAFDRFNNSAQGTISVRALPPPAQDAAGGPLPFLAALPAIPVALFVLFKSLKRRKGH